MPAGFLVLLVVSDAPPLAEMNPLFYFVMTSKFGCKSFTCLTVSTVTRVFQAAEEDWTVEAYVPVYLSEQRKQK